MRQSFPALPAFSLTLHFLNTVLLSFTQYFHHSHYSKQCRPAFLMCQKRGKSKPPDSYKPVCAVLAYTSMPSLLNKGHLALTCPSRAPQCSGVQPMPVARFTSACAAVRASTTLTQPPRQAQCRGVQPMPLARFTSAPAE